LATERLILIDGYNVIHRTPHLKPGKDRTLQESREKLLNLLSWTIGGEARFIVVFDGAQGGGRDHHQGRIEVRYSRSPQKADDLIRALVEDRVEKVERLTVVTADIEVARHAKAMGADVALSDLFLASVLGPEREGDAEKPASLSKKELEEWAEIFTRRSRPSEKLDEDS
jgi:predicted RNA-binding protein with PIN domain